MYRIIVLHLCVFFATFSFGQSSQSFIAAETDYKKIADVTEYLCFSFFDNANHHANTQKMQSLLREKCIPLIETYMETCWNANLYSLYNAYQNLHALVTGVENLTARICGYSRECTLEEWYWIDMSLKADKWDVRKLPLNAPYCTFTEYVSPDGFKMTVVTNDLPKIPHSYENRIRVEHTYKNGMGGGMNITAPGNTEILQFKDDENPKYYTIMKVSATKE